MLLGAGGYWYYKRRKRMREEAEQGESIENEFEEGDEPKLSEELKSPM